MNEFALVRAFLTRASVTDRNAHIGQLLDARLIPNPYTFTPTADQPVYEVPVVGRDFTHVYGVIHHSTGLTGSPAQMVSTCSWDWYVDRSTARREAFFRLWLKSPAASEWCREVIPDNPTPELLRQKWQRSIETPDGVLVLFRIIVKPGFVYVWHVTPHQEEAMGKQRMTLLQARTQAIGKPALAVPSPEEAHGNEVLEIVSADCGTCPWTGELLTAYGSVCMYDHHAFSAQWFTTPQEALDARERVRAYLDASAERRQQREDLQAATALYTAASAEAWRISESKDFACFHTLPHVKGLAAELYSAERSENLDSVDGYLVATERLLIAVQTIETALNGEHERRLSPWMNDDAFWQLRGYLQVALPQCPLCGMSYVTDEVVEDLIVYGEMQLLCCGEHGLSAEPRHLKEGQAEVPVMVAELDRWAKRVFNSGGEGSKLLYEYESGRPHAQYIELGRIRVGGHMVVRVLAYYRNMAWWHVVLETCGPELLTRIQQITDVSAACAFETTWPARRSCLEQWWRSRLDAMVRSGSAVWLRLERHPQHGWGARRREGATTVAYKVSNPDAQGYDSGRDYFCRITRVPEQAKKSGFELRIVSPDPEAHL